MSRCHTLSTLYTKIADHHQELGDCIALLEKDFDQDILKKAKKLREAIVQETAEMNRVLPIAEKQLIEGKYFLKIDEQLAIYTELGQQEWADEIRSHTKDLIKKLGENQRETMAKINAGMRPVLMPGRETQREDWLNALKELKPFWRELGIEHEVKENNVLKVVYLDVLNKDSTWAQIPEKPYMLWTKSTLEKESIGLSSREQEAFVARKHSETPECYDAADIHPLEYAALQAISTQGERETKKKAIPLDQMESHRSPVLIFSSVGKSMIGSVLQAGFLPFSKELSFTHRRTNPEREEKTGVRLVGRL